MCTWLIFSPYKSPIVTLMFVEKTIIFQSTGFNLFVGNHLVIFCMGLFLDILFYFTYLHLTLLQYHSLLIAAKSLQSCPTLCDPIDGSPPGSPIPGILHARTLEWVAISFSNAWKWKVKGKLLSRVWLFTTPWTAPYQAPLSMGFSRQEHWSGVPLPSPILSWLL